MPLNPLQIIGDEDVARGWTPCLTCEDEGVHRYNGDELYPWDPCDKCGARNLNNAQIADVVNVIHHDGQALIGACLGSRKTGTAVATLNRYKGVWVIVAPLHTLDQWVQAVQEWAPTAEIHVMDAKNKTYLIDLKEATGFSVHLIGWERFRRQDVAKFKNIEGAVLDEVHRMAGLKTASAKAVWKINSVRRLGLSGTPANNKLHGLFNVLHWIWWGNKGHRNKNIFRRFQYFWTDSSAPNGEGWATRHFRLEDVFDKKGNLVGQEIGREKVQHSVIREIPCYIQHLEEETCCEWHPGGVNATLPPVDEPTVIVTDMTPAQAKLYGRAASSNPVLWLDKIGEDGEVEGVAPAYVAEMAQRIRLRQIALAVPSIRTVQTPSGPKQEVYMEPTAKSSKIDALIDLLEDIVEPGDPVLVFTHSKVFAKIVVQRLRAAKELDFPIAEWSGDVKKEHRDMIKAHFGKEGGPQVIVAVIASIAEGTDGLQSVCRREVWLSWDDNMMLNTQGVGRLRRTGQRRRVQRWDIVSRGTIEETQVKSLKARKRKLDASLKAVA